ncbi:MAG: hypothetical protein EBT36_08970 [Betaproteobacteria bacterium]|jgi:acetolactate synthase-1/2/3 large subunit|nr:thiamine pyrophosphate-binding protein [Pseudomonadota bacterium]NBP34960.1 hypothetical protein [Betaproteobacteria bacterium]NBP37160.1 hypothetical protein [Betaproteobacteria bacterium]NBQ78687.1 hypothetical protein [Betaproteobacteria bacterium]NBQ95479.1 hypothetical protein [Betaproteobacteria bacterium]
MEFDHAVIVVHDQMDLAVERFRAMGFFVTDRGFHSLGTINHLIIFENSYIELLGYLPENRDKRPEVRDAPAGLNAWVWRSQNAALTYQQCLARGAPVSAPDRFSRPVQVGDVRDDAVFQTVRVPPEESQAGRYYFCQHEKPHLVWHKPWLQHPNRSCEITAGFAKVADLAREQKLLRQLVGDEPVWPADLVLEADPTLSEGGYMDRLSMACYDLGALRTCLLQQSVPHVMADDCLRIAPNFAMGLCLEFHEVQADRQLGGHKLSSAATMATASATSHATPGLSDSASAKAANDGAEALIRMLQAHGVTTIFGVCGDTSLPYYDALYRLDHGMVHVLARDERSAAYMADGYARVSGRVGVCEGPSGGGATYLAPGLVEANESSVPVLGFSSDVPVTSRGRYPLTELRQEALYAPLSKWNGTVDVASKMADQVRTAFRTITTGRPGAAHLCLPYDVLKAKHDGEGLWAQVEHGSAPAWRSAPDSQAIEQAAVKLAAAKQVVMICGGGVISAGACEALAKLAHHLDAPVCTTVSGKGCLSDHDPLSVGVVGSNGGVLATRNIVANADLVFFIACRTGSTTTEHWRFPQLGTEVIHLDVDPAVISSSYPTAVALVGDAKLGLESLLKALQHHAQTQHLPGSGLAMVAKAQASKWKAFEAIAQSDERPIRPERIIDQLRQALPDDAIVCADPGTPCPYVAAYFKLPKAGRYIVTNRAHGALGYALPAAIGAWYAKPAQRCVAVMGDGSFGFVAGELETVARCGAPILMLVLSNDAFGWIKASQRASYGKRYFSVDFRPTDHAAIARAYGIDAYSVEDPRTLGPCLREALALNRPVLVDIKTQALEDAAAPVSQWMG